MTRYVSIFTLLLALAGTSLSQVTTIQNGGWHQATTWSNNQVPDTNTNVIVRHTVDISNSTGCRNIIIDSTGVLFNGRLDIYGSLLNYGWFDAYRNASSYDGISVRDSITNYGKLDTEVLWLTGDRDHYIISRDTIKIADMTVTHPDRTIYLSGKVIFKGGWILLKGSNISFNDTLVLVGTVVDGGVLDGNGNVLHGSPGLIGWSGASSFDPRHTTIKNMTLTGSINFYGSGTDIWGVTIAENVFNKSAVYDRVLGQPEYEQIYITHPFTNEGSFNIAQNGLTVALSSNLINRGRWNNYMTIFMGLTDQTISMPTDSILRGIVHFDAMIQGNAYQWMKNNVNIPGGTQAKLVFNNLTPANSGVYVCKITTNTGVINSRTITVSSLTDIVEPGNLPEEFVLEQNYPNPFNPETNIRYSLPSAGNVEMKVYNSLGEVVAQPVSGFIPAGEHTAYFDATGLTSGVYFYELNTGGYRAVKKMVLLK